MPSYWPIKNTLVQILHCFACDTGIRPRYSATHLEWESRLTNYVLFLSLWSIQSMSNHCCAKEKYKQKRHVFCWKTRATKQTLIETPFFSVSVWTKHGKNFPLENPQKITQPQRLSPTDASCSIHGSKCAGSRYRIELRQLVYLKVGGPRADFVINGVVVIGGPYKMAENHCVFFFAPYKMELYVIPIFQNHQFLCKSSVL